MTQCQHLHVLGDNYGRTCSDCGKPLEGFGYGGWFGRFLTKDKECIHRYVPCGDGEICLYCEDYREKEN